MRQFFTENQLRIGQPATGQLSLPSSKGQSVTGELTIIQAATEKSGALPFLLSWSHYVELLVIKDPDERSFYEIESRQSNWNVRELKRQKASNRYEL